MFLFTSQQNTTTTATPTVSTLQCINYKHEIVCSDHSVTLIENTCLYAYVYSLCVFMHGRIMFL